MRTLTLIFVSILVFCLFFAGCIVQIVSTAPGTDVINSVSTAAAAPSTLQLISLAVLGIYEVVVRAMPSVGNYSVVSWFITALKFVSDKLNATKNP
jgi:PBP1b-binding outer membrane lipoprotein LpoB